MRSQLVRTQLAKQRLRSNSNPLIAVPPSPTSTDYSIDLAHTAAHILYRSPLPSPSDLPIFILNAAGFPDANTADYDALLPYVLARLPDEEELIGGHGYEIVFFAGGTGNVASQQKKGRPGWGWFLQAYHLLTRATRKRLQKLYLVHEKNWIRVLVEMFASVVSPKFRKKIVHMSTLNELAQYIFIEDLLIPPSAYLTDRRKSPSIYIPYTNGRRAFGVKQPLPVSTDGSFRLPRVLREATGFVLLDENIKTEGIFRISARAQTVEILKEAYDRGQRFIVWKELNAVQASSVWKEGTGDVWVEDVDQTEGYELHAAAALIKLWYKELKEPIFPPSCYQILDKHFSSPEVSLETSQLQALLSMEDEWTPISNKTSRQILTMHLLPLLSRVAEFSDSNQMTPENLALCFAPSLLHGPDPLEDLKHSSTIRRLLVAMITQWKDLEPLLSTSFSNFQTSLLTPDPPEDRDDPPDSSETPTGSASTTAVQTQIAGITLMDNESSDSDLESDSRSPPPLPPRPRAATAPLGGTFTDRKIASSSSSSTTAPASAGPSSTHNPSIDVALAAAMAEGIGPYSNVRRKPAPALQPLPRYSTIITDRPAILLGVEDRYYNTVEPQGEGEEGGGDEAGGWAQMEEEDLPAYRERMSLMVERPDLNAERFAQAGRSSLASLGSGEAEEARTEVNVCGEPERPAPLPPTRERDGEGELGMRRKPVPGAKEEGGGF